MTHRPSRQFRRVAGQGGVKMSLFDAMIKDFFGADPFIHMRPVLQPVGPGSRPGPRNTGSLPPGPHAVQRVTHMVEGATTNGTNATKTFRQITYASGSKSMNNISNVQNGQNGVKKTSNNGNQEASQKPQKISNGQPAITYQNSAPKPHNPDRGKRCSSVCEGWKRSLRTGEKPERLLPAITKTEKLKAEDSKMRPTMVGVPSDPNGYPKRRASERYSRHTAPGGSTVASRKRSNSNSVSEGDLNLNKSYPGAKSRSRKGMGS